ncbi:MAG: bifunctional DNA-formamidopyrimidine glycosylase/DNA-(apurinic or apyrimidinic site) lyase [Thermomicrobiales bacterium]|nr:bifunctional DNA-formamidopyrimidine glycosylase/DNA-(apurinic or apyrimidinic site) lyase [Thermomicrobiales bacterium]
MPELPEVETSRRIVLTDLKGLSVDRVVVRLPKLFRFSEIPSAETLFGHTVIGARRRAKVLMIDFSGDLTLMVHFKLAGQLSVHHPDGRRATAGHPVPKPDGEYPHKSTHVELWFDDGTVAYFSDIRQFGWFRLMPSDNVEAAIDAFGFGPEGTGDERISLEALKKALSRRSIPVKTAILDQSLVAGVGNIYADEALWFARIFPGTPANQLSAIAVRRLWEGIDHALIQGLAQGGATIIHQKAYPVDGFPAVHGREGEPCPRCGTPIQKIEIGTRGTYFCPKCQKRPRLQNSGSTSGAEVG